MINEKIKYSEFVMKWIQYHKQFVKESTYSNYQNIVDNHLSVDFNTLNLDDFDNIVLQNYVLHKYAAGSVDNGPLAIKSVKDIMVVLKLSLRYAFSQNLLRSFDLNVKYPRTTSSNSIAILSNKSICKIVKYIDLNSNQKDVGIMIALLTGLRIGEICALKYSDINLKTNKITISKTLQRIYTKANKTKLIESTPKTNSSFREIPLSVILKGYIKQTTIKDDNYILSNSLKPVEPRLLRNRFDHILKINKIQHYKFHTLRHTFATKCIEAKIDYKTISVLLGHSNINTTLNLYVHPNNSQKKRAINKLTAFMFK